MHAQTFQSVTVSELAILSISSTTTRNIIRCASTDVKALTVLMANVISSDPNDSLKCTRSRNGSVWSSVAQIESTLGEGSAAEDALRHCDNTNASV